MQTIHIINIHINTHLAQTIWSGDGLAGGHPSKILWRSNVLQRFIVVAKSTPPISSRCVPQKVRSCIHSSLCIMFLLFFEVHLCVVWMSCMFIDASTRISTCVSSIFPFHRAFLGDPSLLLFPKENSMETRLPSWSVLKWPFLKSRSWSMMYDQFQWIICLSAIQTKWWLNICETWGIIVSIIYDPCLELIRPVYEGHTVTYNMNLSMNFLSFPQFCIELAEPKVETLSHWSIWSFTH